MPRAISQDRIRTQRIPGVRNAFSEAWRDGFGDATDHLVSLAIRTVAEGRSLRAPLTFSASADTRTNTHGRCENRANTQLRM